jgi:hypothetical protein
LDGTGVVSLLSRQTADEQSSDNTIYHNNRGFNGTDAHYLTYVAKYIQRGNHLSGKHIAKVAHKLPKYWGQILEEIEQKGN